MLEVESISDAHWNMLTCTMDSHPTLSKMDKASIKMAWYCSSFLIFLQRLCMNRIYCCLVAKLVSKLNTMINRYINKRNMDIQNVLLQASASGLGILPKDDKLWKCAVEEYCTIFWHKLVHRYWLDSRMFHHLDESMGCQLGISEICWLISQAFMAPVDVFLMTGHFFMSLKPSGHLWELILHVCCSACFFCKINM